MAISLPKIRQGVLSKATLFSANQLDDATKKRINFFYAKDYDYSIDVGVIWKGWKGLGEK